MLVHISLYICGSVFLWEYIYLCVAVKREVWLEEEEGVWWEEEIINLGTLCLAVEQTFTLQDRPLFLILLLSRQSQPVVIRVFQKIPKLEFDPVKLGTVEGWYGDPTK